MKAGAVTVSLVPGQWTDMAEKWLSLTGSHYLAEYYAQWKAGATLLYVRAHGQTCGAVLLRVDARADGYDGVIVAAASKVRGVDLVEKVLPVVERMFCGVDTIRIHTARSGLVAKLKKSGYEQSEVVMTKKVAKCHIH